MLLGCVFVTKRIVLGIGWVTSEPFIFQSLENNLKGQNSLSIVDWLYGVSRCFQQQYNYPCFPGVLLNSTPRNILSKPQAAFPHNHCRNNGQQWERNKSCCNDYHQSSERILAEPLIKPATSCSLVRYTTDWALGSKLKGKIFKQKIADNMHISILWKASHQVLLNFIQLKSRADIKLEPSKIRTKSHVGKNLINLTLFSDFNPSFTIFEVIGLTRFIRKYFAPVHFGRNMDGSLAPLSNCRSKSRNLSTNIWKSSWNEQAMIC